MSEGVLFIEKSFVKSNVNVFFFGGGGGGVEGSKFHT